LEIRHFSIERHSRRQEFVSPQSQCRNLILEIDQFGAEFVSLYGFWFCRCLDEPSHLSVELSSHFSTVTGFGSCIGSQFWNRYRRRTDTTVPPPKNAGNLEVEVETRRCRHGSH
jgi:hypothetical protein